MSILVAILGLAFLVLIHEAGHFFVSLAVGMRPRKFYVGFPPAIVKTKRKGIEYGLGAIPLGGYVRIPGMHRPAAKDVDLVFSRALHPELVGPAERLKRALAIEDYETAEVRLAEFRQRAVEFGVPSIEKQVGDLEDALSPQAYWRAPTWKRVAAIAAGPVTNLVFAVVMFAVVFATSAGKVTTTVDHVLLEESGKRAPALAAGLRRGDSLAAIEISGNWTVVDKASDITDTIGNSKGQPITLLVSRNNRPVTLGPVRPLRTGSDNAYRLGFQLKAEPLALGAAFWESVKTTGVVARDTVKALGGIFHRKERSQIGGPVGIGRTAADAVHYGWASYLAVLAFISLSLALLNLLPLLPLDGGHIAFSLLEGIRGRAIAREVYERVSAVGIAIVLLLFVVGLSNDVGRLGG
jgi:regulator of sigma E protease